MKSATDTSPKTITVPQHQRFVHDAMAAAGAHPDDAKIIGEALLWAELRGRTTNGLVRLSNMVKRYSMKLINSPSNMSWTNVAPAVEILDANNAFGHVAAYAATRRAMKIAGEQGIGYVGVRHSNHYGAAAYYCALAAADGYLGITGTNAFPKVAPYGGTRPVLGTNPLGFGCPTGSGAPILVDFSTSAISGAEVRSNVAEHANLPMHVAVDGDGRPTNDPAAAISGCLLPAAGPKGFGLALMIEVLSGLLTCSAMGKEVGSLFKTWDRPLDTGHFFIAINIERFMPQQAFLQRVDTLLSWIAEVPTQPGVEEILYPGEIRGRNAAKYQTEGIPLSIETVQSVEQLAETLHIQTPW